VTTYGTELLWYRVSRDYTGPVFYFSFFLGNINSNEWATSVVRRKLNCSLTFLTSLSKLERPLERHPVFDQAANDETGGADSLLLLLLLPFSDV